MWWSVDMIYTDLSKFDSDPDNSSNNNDINNQNDENGSDLNGSFFSMTGKGDVISSAMRDCYKGFLESIPPTFCYKKNGDAGKIPTDCPDGYFRSLAMCY